MPDLNLKSISKDAIPAALEKARHYRLLNQPWQAESICRDILSSDPDNQQVIYTLVLAMTDQFDGKFKRDLSQTLSIVKKMADDYHLEYCTGLIYERQAKAALNRKTPRAGYIAYDNLIKAMQHYEKAEKLRPPNDEESILRWNACVRFLDRHKLKPSPDETERQPFLDV